ncbi:MAG: hypothetical protein HYS21_12685 [Deltaproteobacteria bacterium]|nr:hypothetical protein [Deltaproteobacteria bacterium]
MKKWQVLALALLMAVPATGFAQIGKLKLDSKVDSMHKAGVGPVIFPHDSHEKLYKCNDCHPKIFKEKRGESGISMKLNMDGKFCGSPNCHNSPKAFPLFECTKCHTNVGAAK